MKTPVRLLIASWFIVGSSFSLPSHCIANTAVTLHPSQEINKAAVRLSDLFIGVPDEIDRDIAQAPLPGKQAVYDQNVLSKLADKYRLDWTPAVGVDHVTLTSACTRITNETIRHAVAQKIKDAGAKGDAEVSFDTKGFEIDLPPTQAPDFTLENFDYDAVAKRFHADMSVDTPQGPATVPLSGRVSLKRHLPVLARRLEAGTIIGAADIDWVDVGEDRVNDSVVTDAQQLIGRELRHATGEDELMHGNDVLPPRLVLRGSLITMKIETPMMVVTAQGKAAQDGALGETVRVINTQSNRMIEGTVIAPGTVAIPTAQKLAAADDN